MKNTLNKFPFYKKTAVMIIETSIGVNFGEANPFIQFKFAQRENEKAKGTWIDENCFWVTNYTELYSFVTGINLVASGKIEKYELKNPMKNVMVQIRASSNESTKVDYVTFHFFRGKNKEADIKVSLIKNTEFAALFAYFKNLMENYNTVCATALLRNDIHYEFFVKGKDQKSGQSSKPQSSDNKYQSQKPQDSDSGDDDTGYSGFGGDDAGSTTSFGDDVPF